MRALGDTFKRRWKYAGCKRGRHFWEFATTSAWKSPPPRRLTTDANDREIPV